MFDDMSGSGASPKADKSVWLYSLSDGLSQISWLCQVLEEYAKVHKEAQQSIVAQGRHWKIVGGIQGRLSLQYTGERERKRYTSFVVLSDVMCNFANATHCDVHW
jgi:hypothetical protein